MAKKKGRHEGGAAAGRHEGAARRDCGTGAFGWEEEGVFPSWQGNGLASR